MRRQDKYKNIEQANLMLENHYLKSKGLLKESENTLPIDLFYDFKRTFFDTFEDQGKENFYKLIYDNYYKPENTELDFESFKNEYYRVLTDSYAEFRNGNDKFDHDYIFKPILEKALTDIKNSFKNIQESKNIEQANLMLENHYLKRKELLKEDEENEDMPFNDLKLNDKWKIVKLTLDDTSVDTEEFLNQIKSGKRSYSELSQEQRTELYNKAEKYAEDKKIENEKKYKEYLGRI